MQEKDISYFELLKTEVVRTFRQSHPEVSEDITEWKGQTIYDFQDDLLEKVQDQISEKWFYNHMKARAQRLPRVDMLNLLSRYAGYSGWQDFVFKNQESLPIDTRDRSNRVFIMIPVLVISFVALFILVFRLLSTREYRFCFVNNYDGAPIAAPVQIDLLHDGESPTTLTADSSGCVPVRTNQVKLRFVVKAPYYKTDTIDRILKKFNRQETVRLRTDDYALMLHYFTTANVSDWKKRREQLEMMFADDARIYEVFQKGTLGVEMYDKNEFINKLSVPTQSLQHIRILDTEYAGDRIVALRFTEVENEK